MTVHVRQLRRNLRDATCVVLIRGSGTPCIGIVHAPQRSPALGSPPHSLASSCICIMSGLPPIPPRPVSSTTSSVSDLVPPPPRTSSLPVFTQLPLLADGTRAQSGVLTPAQGGGNNRTTRTGIKWQASGPLWAGNGSVLWARIMSRRVTLPRTLTLVGQLGSKSVYTI